MQNHCAANSNNRIVWISAANVFATLAVVFLHCNGVFWTFPKGRLWYSSNFIETFFYWGVPVFFMISGATLMDYRRKYSTSHFLKKRFNRTFIPFIIWSLIGAAYQTAVGSWKYHGLRALISDIFQTKIIAIYWFFIPLFALYMSIPVFSAIKDEKKNKIFNYLVLVGSVFLFVLPLIFKLLNINYNAEIVPPVASGYLVYLLLGYQIARSNLSKKQRVIIYSLGIIGWFLQFGGTILFSVRSGTLDATWKGYTNFPCLLESAAIFVVFRYTPWEKILKERGVRIINSASKYTFGVYLIHVYFVWQIPYRLGINSSGIFFRTIGAVLIFLCCLCICALIARIPYLKKIIGV